MRPVNEARNPAQVGKNQENEATPNLFSDDQTESENKDSKNEVKELEMFESQDTEEDFEKLSRLNVNIDMDAHEIIQAARELECS